VCRAGGVHGLGAVEPGNVDPGAGFISARQGEIPFFDETTINRIRSDIKRYHSTDPQVDVSEAGFSARLFLAVAQENDLAADLLDHDLHRFKVLEKDFLDALTDTDDVTFKREASGETLWREDPGAKLTGQRIRSWFQLAAADADLPALLVTTSRLGDGYPDGRLWRRPQSRTAGRHPTCRPICRCAVAMGRVLADLATQATLSPADVAPFTALAGDAVDETAVAVTLFGAVNHRPAAVIGRLS
jgi:hypothetical protein